MENHIAQSQFTSLINSMNDGVIVADDSKKIVLYNAAALNLLDINTSIEKKLIADVVTLRDKNNKKVSLSILLDSNRKLYESNDLRIYYEDESYIAVSVNARPIYASYGSKKTEW